MYRKLLEARTPEEVVEILTQYNQIDWKDSPAATIIAISTTRIACAIEAIAQSLQQIEKD